LERRIDNKRDDDDYGDGGDEFLAMWFELDPQTIYLALGSEKFNNNNNSGVY
jgi:hypothetical protein